MIAKAEDEKASAFAISKEDIDSVLQKGSGVADGKYRIYRQFQKGEDRQKNIEFLKNEYGTGGGTHRANRRLFSPKDSYRDSNSSLPMTSRASCRTASR